MRLVRAGILAVEDPVSVSSSFAYGGPNADGYDDGDDAGALFGPGWQEYQLSKDLRVKLKKGKRLKVTNVGTAAAPRYDLEVVAGGLGELAESGFLPLLVPAAKLAMKVAKGPPTKVQALKPGETTTLGALFIDTDGRRVQDGDAS